MWPGALRGAPGEPLDSLLGVGKDLSARKTTVAHVPDPGGRHVPDAHCAAAQVDPASDQHAIALPLDPRWGDQQLLPSLRHVLQVFVQATGADVGSRAANFGGGDGEELHLLVANGGDPKPVATIESLEKAPDQFLVAAVHVRRRARGRAVADRGRSYRENRGVVVEGPVSEGMFAWIVGIGTLVGFAIWIASSTARSARKGAQQ